MRTIDLTTASWRKSSHSNQDGGACVEVSDDFPSVVPIRDSKRPEGAVLLFPAAGWTAFVRALHAGELNV